MTKSARFRLAFVSLLLALILLLSYLIDQGSTYDVDTYLLRLYRADAPDYKPLGSPRMQSVIRDVTALGSGVILTCLTLCVVIYHFLRHRWRTGYFVALVILLGWQTMEGLKLIYHRPRPTVVPHLAVESSLSLPSGHAMMSMIVYLTLAGIAGAQASSRSLRFFYFTLAVLLALIIGATRVYLGVHHPSDVLAGWLLGLTWVQLAWLVRSRFTKTPVPNGEKV